MYINLHLDFNLLGDTLLLSIGSADQIVSCMVDVQMIDDTDLGFFANFLGISIFVLLVAYHYVVAEPKYDSQF